MSSPANTVASNALDQLNAIYTQGLDTLEAEAAHIAHLETEASFYKAHLYTTVRGMRFTDTVDLDELNSVYHSEFTQNVVLNNDEAALDTVVDSSQADDLNYAFGALNAALGLGREGIVEHSPGGFISNNTLRNKVLHSVESAIKKLLESDECTQAINTLSASHGSTSQISSIAFLRDQDLSSVSQNMGSLEALISNEQSIYTNKLGSAEIKQDDYTTAEIWLEHFGLFKNSGYTKIIDHAKATLDSLSNISQAMAPLAGLFEGTEMIQLQQLVDQVITSVKSIIENSKMSEKGKVTALLPLMMELLGIYKMIQQATEKQKSRNEADMEKAQVKASQAQIQQSKTNEILQAEIAKDNAVGKVAQGWSTFFNVIIGLVMAAAGSGAAAIAMFTLTILQASHALSDLEELIAKSIVKDSSKTSPENKEAAKIWASIIMTVMEVSVTIAAGALGDVAVNNELLMSSITKTTSQQAVETGLHSAEEAIATTAREVSAISTEASAISEEEANIALRNIGEKAGKIAAKRMYAQLFRQNPFMMVKTLFRQSTKQLLEETVQDAISSSIIKATEELKSGLVLSEQAMDEIATNSANQAIADATKKSVEEISSEGSKSALKSVGQRGLMAAGYGIGSTNLLVDIATWGLEHNQESTTSKSAQALLISLGIIQGIMTAISMMAGGGFLNQANIGREGSSLFALLQRVSGMAQTANQAGQSMFSFTQAEIEKTAAKVQYKEQINTTLSNLLQSYLGNFIQEGKTERSAFIKEQGEETESQNLLVLNLQKGNEEAIKVLTQQAV